MTSFRKKILLVFYIFLLGVVLLYVLFPEDAVKNHLANRINQNLSDIQVDIGKLDLSFPLSLSLRDVVVSGGGDILFSMDRLKVSPRLLSLFSSRKVLSFNGSACNGKIFGVIRIEPDPDGMSISLSGSVENVEFDQVPAISAQTTLGMHGTLSGVFNISATPSGLDSGDGNIVVTDCSFKSPVTLANLQNLTFDRVDANFNIDGNGLEILNCNLDGSDVTGDISGNIFLDRPLPRSDLDLEITATLLLSSSVSDINTYTFKVTGTFESPKIAPVSFH